MGRNSKRIEHDFYCIKCGNKGIPLFRKAGHQHKSFRGKKLFCIFCNEEVNHVECKNYEEVTKTVEVVVAKASVVVSWNVADSYIYSVNGQTLPTASFVDVFNKNIKLDVSVTDTVNENNTSFKNASTYKFTALVSEYMQAVEEKNDMIRKQLEISNLLVLKLAEKLPDDDPSKSRMLELINQLN